MWLMLPFFHGWKLFWSEIYMFHRVVTLRHGFASVMGCSLSHGTVTQPQAFVRLLVFPVQSLSI